MMIPSAFKKPFSTSVIASMTVVLVGSSSLNVNAGAFTFDRFPDALTFPSGYFGNGGPLDVKVCIVPGTPFASEMEQSVKNNVAIWNRQQSTTSNVRSLPLPSNLYDFESVALHEVGHCLGLGHPNLGFQSPSVTGSNTNFTASVEGADSSFSFGVGTDGVIGTADDVRGDDYNIHFFNPNNNNPFSESEIIDSSNYTKDLAQLPVGDLFAANADRFASNTSRYLAPNTEASMQQGTFGNEVQRTLGHDDVATLRYGESGSDNIAGSADDYTVNLTYGGISDAADCDITFAMDATETGFAVCKTSGFFLGPDIRISSARIFFDPNDNWYFTDSPPCSESTPLNPAEWKLISLPCQVGVSTSATLEDVFGDDLGTNNYNVDWAVFTYEYTATAGGYAPEYRLVALTDELKNDAGYWIITNETGKTVDVEGEYQSQMDADLFLEAPANVRGWNMIGMPFRSGISWSDTLVVDTNGDVLSLAQADPDVPGGPGFGTACTGGTPTSNCKVASYSWSFNGTTYDLLSPTSGTLAAFDAAWVFTGEPGMHLRFPMTNAERTTP